MYLSLLNDRQKQLFLMLSYNLANSDGDFSEAEQLMINSYATEMGISPNINNSFLDDSQIIDELEKSTGKREKKIIIFELIGLAMSDSSYNALEHETIRKVATKFAIDAAFEEYCEKKISEYLMFQNSLNEVVLN